MLVKTFDELKAALYSIGCTSFYSAEFLYRGMSNSEYKLIPSLFYPPKPSNPKEVEKNRLTAFISSTNYGKERTPEERIWLNAFLSRHWGLGIRLMDWSIHLGTALYFISQSADLNKVGILYVLPSDSIEALYDIPHASYFEFEATAMLNPPFYEEELNTIGSTNRFIQDGRFLIQDYKSASKCFYERNSKVVTKIEIPQINMNDIYQECCKGHSDNPDVSLLIDLQSDPNYKLCTDLNN